VSVVADGPGGLPLEEIYAAEVGALRARGRRVAEVSALAVARSQGRATLDVVVPLVRLVLIFASALEPVDDLCIAVNPRHATFYRALLRFEALGARRAYGKVNGAPALALRLDLGEVRAHVDAALAGAAPPGRRCRELLDPAAWARDLARLRRELAAEPAPAGA
jgi:hypothetical protein